MLWMSIIARNLAMDLVRRPAREVVSDDTVLWSFPADNPTPLEAIEIYEDQADALMHQLKVQYALQALEPRRRHLIIAAYIRGEKPKVALRTIRRAGQYHQDLDQARPARNPRQPAKHCLTHEALIQRSATM